MILYTCGLANFISSSKGNAKWHIKGRGYSTRALSCLVSEGMAGSTAENIRIEKHSPDGGWGYLIILGMALTLVNNW